MRAVSIMWLRINTGVNLSADLKRQIKSLPEFRYLVVDSRVDSITGVFADLGQTLDQCGGLFQNFPDRYYIVDRAG